MTERVDDTAASSWLPGASGPSRVLSVVVPAILCAAILELLGPTWFADGPIALGPLPALLAGAMLAGPLAVVGTVAGYVGYHAVHATLSLWEPLGFLAFGLVGWFVWRPSAESTVGSLGSTGGAARFAVAVVLGALWGAGLVGWGHELTGQANFYPTAPFFVADTVLPALAVGALAAGVLAALGDRFDVLPAARSGASLRSVAPSTVVVTPLVWVALGSLASVAFQVLALVPAFHFRVRDLGALLVLTDAGVVGPGGVAVQVALGVVCLVVLVASLRRQLPTTA